MLVVGASTSALGAPQAQITVDDGAGPAEIATSSTFNPGSFSVVNTGGVPITGLRFDLGAGPALFPNLVFDPDDGTFAGDTVAKSFTQDRGTAGGVVADATYSGANGNGFDVLQIQTTSFDPGDTLEFSIDIDPASIQGSPGTAPAGPVTGAELHGATVTVDFAGAPSLANDLARTGDTTSAATVAGNPSSASTLQLCGPLAPPALTSNGTQLVRATGAQGASGFVLVAEGELASATIPTDDFEVNSVVEFKATPFTIGVVGHADVKIQLSNAGVPGPGTGTKYVTALLDGRPASDAVVLRFDPGSPSSTTEPFPGDGDGPGGDFGHGGGEPSTPGTGSGEPSPPPGGVGGGQSPAEQTSGGQSPAQRGATACAEVPERPTSRGNPDDVSATAAQLLINQRISQAAVRRTAVVQAWLDAGLVAGDLCGGAIRTSAFGPGVTLGAATAAQRLAPASPRPVDVPAGKRGGAAAIVPSARQLLINQRISQAVVRRANALKTRFDAGLTGGDIRDGEIGPGQLAPEVALVSAAPVADPPPASCPAHTGCERA